MWFAWHVCRLLRAELESPRWMWRMCVSCRLVSISDGNRLCNLDHLLLLPSTTQEGQRSVGRSTERSGAERVKLWCSAASPTQGMERCDGANRWLGLAIGREFAGEGSGKEARVTLDPSSSPTDNGEETIS